jgi:hypothetical protein
MWVVGLFWSSSAVRIVGTCSMEDHRVVRQTVILQLYGISGGSRCLKISGRKVVCELLLAGRVRRLPEATGDSYVGVVQFP